MQKSQIRILIVEDDPILGKALEAALQRAGYTTHWAKSYSAAKADFEANLYHGVIVDCMLPQKSGVDLAVEWSEKTQTPLVTLLTSGIFKDKSFISDVKIRAKARQFFSKPFDITELIKELDDAFAHQIEVLKEPLYELLKVRLFSTQDKINAIKRTQAFHGYDLPLLYAFLMDKNLCGELEIKYSDGLESHVEFQHGRIASVQHHDTESYFGTLLVERGFCELEDVEQQLKMNSDKRIGDRLVDASILSPHAIDLVHHDQMVIRLSKTIKDDSIQVSFKEQNSRMVKVFIDHLEFTQLLSDWILSKINSQWLQRFYLHWKDHTLIEGPEYNKALLLESLPVLKPVVQSCLRGSWPKTIQEILNTESQNESKLLAAIHFMLIQRIFILEGKSSQLSFNDQLERLRKLRNSIKKQNYFEIFNLNSKARGSEITRAYHALAKNFHPDKVPSHAPEEVHRLTQEIFSVITEAYQVLNNEKKREEYLLTLEYGAAEDVLQSESAFDEGFRLLQTGRFRDARKQFEGAMKLKGHRSDLMIYIIWALIREKQNTSRPEALSQKVSELFNEVPHEDRHSPHYFFVRGLHYSINKDFQKAYSNFKRAYTMDPQFEESKKEISLLKYKYQRHKATAVSELSQVMTSLFKKRAS